MIAVNVIGQAGAGKSTVARYLHEQHGFEVHRPSDALRDYAAKNRLPLRGRKDYALYHRTLIAEDPEVIIRPILESSVSRICIDGLRVIAHARQLKHSIGMSTLALDCPPEVCLSHIQGATEWRHFRDESRIGSLEEYLADISVDSNNPDPLEINVELVMGMADKTIHIGADTTLDEVLHLGVDPYIGQLLETA